MKLFQFLIAAMLLIFVGSVYAEKPKPVIEQNLDTNGDIKVAIQNTDAIPVHEQGLVDVNVTGGQVTATIPGGVAVTNTVQVEGAVTVDSIPNVVIQSMPPMLNGDHPALTNFSQRKNFLVPSEVAYLYFNYEGHKVCNPGDKVIITTITGNVTGLLATPTTLPVMVKIDLPVLYYLSDSGYSISDLDSRYNMVWNEKTNIIIDEDRTIKLEIWQGPTFVKNSGWSGRWSIFGYCFSP